MASCPGPKPAKTSCQGFFSALKDIPNENDYYICTCFDPFYPAGIIWNKTQSLMFH